MRILNYLDDWLVLAQSRDTLVSHMNALLHHLESLGLCGFYMQKSIFESVYNVSGSRLLLSGDPRSPCQMLCVSAVQTG